MPLIVTRPQSEARRWQEGLQARGVPVEVFPLVEIAESRDPDAVDRAWRRWPLYQVAMFVSGQAVHAFFKARAHRGGDEAAPEPGQVRTWATGPGTVAALLREGIPASNIDAPAADATQFDSEALWSRVRTQVGPSTLALVVRGSNGNGQINGRDWLVQQLLAAGACVDQVAAYVRRAQVWSEAMREQARQWADPASIWLFSSSEAVGHLGELLPQQDWRGSRAMATHPRIAHAARALGFGVVWESRPTLDDVVASLKSGL